MREESVIQQLVPESGTFPNNKRLPLLLYKGAFSPEAADLATRITAVFKRNRWHGLWRNGIYAYHHYHSTAHEALGVYRGRACVLFGGPGGPAFTAEKGDVVLIPAGVAHCNTESSFDFGVVGAYPQGQNWDMCYGEKGERPTVDKVIASVPPPTSDPVYGENGILCGAWR